MEPGKPDDQPALPIRGRVSARRSASPEPTTPAALSDAEVTSEALREVRDRVDRFNVGGLLVASRDGLVLCGDTQDIENGSVAAMAAAATGLAAQFTGLAALGEPQAAMFEGALGHVGVFPVEETILLVVFGSRGTTMGMFNVAARQALAELQQAIARQRVRSPRETLA